MRYEPVPETIARLERHAAEEMTCMNWWGGPVGGLTQPVPGFLSAGFETWRWHGGLVLLSILGRSASKATRS